MKKLIVTFLGKTKAMFVAAVFVVLIMVAVYVFVITTIQKKTDTYTNMFNDTQAQIDAFYELANQKKLVADTAEHRQQLASYFINQDSVGNLFEKLEEIATVANVEFSVVSARLGQTTEEGLRIQVSADGAFKSVYHFFMLLETIPFGIEIATFNMQSNDSKDISATNQPWRGIFDIEVITYTE